MVMVVVPVMVAVGIDMLASGMTLGGGLWALALVDVCGKGGG
jgi:hypothetical protein